MPTEMISSPLIAQRDYHRTSQRECPVCRRDCGRFAPHRLAYVFVDCDCDADTYTHLVEQVYHQDCLVADVPRLIERDLLGDCLYYLARNKRTVHLVQRLRAALGHHESVGEGE